MKLKMLTRKAIIGGDPLAEDDVDEYGGWVRKAGENDTIIGYACSDAVGNMVEVAVQGWRMGNHIIPCREGDMEFMKPAMRQIQGYNATLKINDDITWHSFPVCWDLPQMREYFAGTTQMKYSPYGDRWFAPTWHFDGVRMKRVSDDEIGGQPAFTVTCDVEKPRVEYKHWAARPVFWLWLRWWRFKWAVKRTLGLCEAEDETSRQMQKDNAD